MRRLVIAIAALGLAGCSLIVNGSDYLTDGSAPRPDGGDADVPIDGGADGGPLANVPPLASGIGLSNHRPFLGESLRAIVGPIFDADGDTVTREITWYVNDVEYEPAAGSVSLLLDPSIFGTGEFVQAELTVSDADGPGNTVRSGVALIEPDDVTQWRQIAPLTYDTAGMRALDTDSQRLLFESAPREGSSSLWELQLTPDGPGRWVQIFPGGMTPPGQQPAIFRDRENHRLITFGGQVAVVGGGDQPTDALFALELERGAERWVELSGTVPTPRFVAVTASTDDESRAWLYGGLEGATIHNDLWEVDVASATFTELTGELGGDPTNATIGASLVYDAANERLVRFGGANIDLATGEPSPIDQIGVIDLTATPPTFEVVGVLPRPLMGAGSAVVGDTVYLAAGATTGLAPNTTVFEVSLEDFAINEFDLPDGPFALLPIVHSRVPFSDSYVVSGYQFEGGPGDFYQFDFSGLTPLAVTGVTAPYASHQGTAWSDSNGTMYVLGGMQEIDNTDTIVDQMWRLDPQGLWEQVLPGGAEPEARRGMVMDGSHPYRPLYQVLGEGGGDLLFPTDVSFTRGTTWEQLPVVSTAFDPARRFGVAVYSGECRGPDPMGIERASEIGVFGGVDGSGNYFQNTRLLRCDIDAAGDPSVCAWENPIMAMGQEPSARAWASITSAGWDTAQRVRHAWLFGGLSSTGANGELWTIDACQNADGPFQWTQPGLEPGSVLPSPRYAHTAVHVRAPEGGPGDGPGSQILIFGGATTEFGGEVEDVWRITPFLDGMGFFYVRSEPIVPVGISPGPRAYHVAVWDHLQERMIVFGGRNNDTVYDDVWELRVRE